MPDSSTVSIHGFHAMQAASAGDPRWHDQVTVAVALRQMQRVLIEGGVDGFNVAAVTRAAAVVFAAALSEQTARRRSKALAEHAAPPHDLTIEDLLDLLTDSRMTPPSGGGR